jgi:hypothetical protein
VGARFPRGGGIGITSLAKAAPDGYTIGIGTSAGLAINPVALNPPDTGSNGDPEIDVLRLVQPILRGRDRSSGGWQAETAADLEQDP